MLRILQNASCDIPVAQLYANFNTLTLPKLHNYQILAFIHKFIHHQNKLSCIFYTHVTQNYTGWAKKTGLFFDSL